MVYSIVLNFVFKIERQGFMGKFTHFWFSLLTGLCLLGCTLDRSGTAPPLVDDAGDAEIMMDAASEDSGLLDGATPDSGSMDSGQDDASIADASTDSGTDAGMDADLPDAGLDSGTDAGRDSGFDSGTDAGPPHVITLVFHKTELSFGPVRSFWVRVDSGSWGRAGCVGGITVVSDTYSCELDITFPLGTRSTLRWYAAEDSGGTSGSCSSANCTFRGSHDVLLDGFSVAPIDLTVEPPMAPYPPAGMVRVNRYTTP